MIKSWTLGRIIRLWMNYNRIPRENHRRWTECTFNCHYQMVTGSDETTTGDHGFHFGCPTDQHEVTRVDRSDANRLCILLIIFDWPAVYSIPMGVQSLSLTSLHVDVRKTEVNWRFGRRQWPRLRIQTFLVVHFYHSIPITELFGHTVLVDHGGLQNQRKIASRRMMTHEVDWSHFLSGDR